MFATELVLNPPIQYPIIWLVAGCIVLALLVVSCALILWRTRVQRPKTLDTIAPLPVVSRLDALKQQYTERINAVDAAYQTQQIGVRELHASLSMIVREFVYEVTQLPAPKLTLSDLRRTPYQTLTTLIAGLYPSEFESSDHGDAHSAVGAAREVVQQWN